MINIEIISLTVLFKYQLDKNMKLNSKVKTKL